MSNITGVDVMETTDFNKTTVTKLKGLKGTKLKSIVHARERLTPAKSCRCYIAHFKDGTTVKFYVHGEAACATLSAGLSKAEYLGIDKRWLGKEKPPTKMDKVGIGIKVKDKVLRAFVHAGGDRGGSRSATAADYSPG